MIKLDEQGNLVETDALNVCQICGATLATASELKAALAEAGMVMVPREKLQRLVFAARTSGGTPGRDDDLCAALDAIEPLIQAQEE